MDDLETYSSWRSGSLVIADGICVRKLSSSSLEQTLLMAEGELLLLQV